MPTDPTLVRPEDDEMYEWGLPGPYGNASLYYSGEAAKSDDEAMQSLRTALNQSPEISPTQGIAAALLAAIPTFGGYMIGKSVGDPNIPEGVTGMDFSKYQTGGYAGGLMGAEVGQRAAGGYLKELDADAKAANEVKLKQALVQQQRATQMRGMAGNTVSAGLAAQENRALMPLEEEQRMREIRAQGNENIRVNAAHEAARDKYRDNEEMFLPEAQANSFGRPDLANKLISKGEYKTVVDSAAEMRRREQQDLRAAGGIPPTPSGKVQEKLGAADNVLQTQGRIRELYDSAAAQIGPGFAQSFIRSGVAALPANIQQEFISTIDALAMELNKAVDPTPSDAGRLAQRTKLMGALENGDFLNLLDYDAKTVRMGALRGVKPYVVGGNQIAKKIYDAYLEDWGMTGAELESDPISIQPSKADLMRRLQELENK